MSDPSGVPRVATRPKFRLLLTWMDRPIQSHDGSIADALRNLGPAMLPELE
jgi:hypothetical protein